VTDDVVTDPFRAATAVADAVLYEGYLLYPYRASSDKNRMRFQFGVLVPPGAEEATSESSSTQTECLCEPRGDATLTLRVRFLHLRSRQVFDPAGAPVRQITVAGVDHLTWDEAVEREIDATLRMADILAGEVAIPLRIEASGETESLTDNGVPVGRVDRTCAAIDGRISVSATEVPGPYGAVRLRVTVANLTAADDVREGRDAALSRALLGAHTLLALSDGEFLSLTDAPEWAQGATAQCENIRTWPVLVGEAPVPTVMLSAPIILYDFPSIAPESPGPLFDGTEIDEILTLRTMTLTDDEKRQARATDGRAREMLDRRHRGGIRPRTRPSIRIPTASSSTASPWPGAAGSG
jgi:hypothetical protein